MNNNEFEDIIELNIDKTQEGERIDKFLSDMLSSYSRSYVQKLIKIPKPDIRYHTMT